jgi:hypothetical protein
MALSYGLLQDTANNSHYVQSNGRMSGEWQIGNGFEESGLALSEVQSDIFPKESGKTTTRFNHDSRWPTFESKQESPKYKSTVSPLHRSVRQRRNRGVLRLRLRPTESPACDGNFSDIRVKRVV